MHGSVGIISGETGSFGFNFLISDSTAVHRGEYVKAWHESDGWVLCQVLSIKRSSDVANNKHSFDEAKKVFDELKKESKANKRSDRIVAEATVIGSRDPSGLLRSPKTPFSPGDDVFPADNDLISSALGLSGNEMYIGMLDGTDIPVHLSVNSLVQKHVSILAKTGSGKSYTAAVLLEELLDRKVPLLIIDPHSEYASMKDPSSKNDGFKKFGISPKGYGSDVTIYTPANKVINPNADELFRLNGNNLTAKDLTAIFPDNFTATHIGILYEAIQKLRAEMETYTLDDIIFEVGNNESKARWNVMGVLEDIRDSDILSSSPTELNELMCNGKASVIDFKGVPPELQSMIVARLCSALFEARKMNSIPPGMLVVEEAHNFAPERGFSKTVSSEVLRTIASEGRKFGLGMMVISQRPARIDKNVLSQCGTQVIMKVTNPNDLKSISKGLEGVNSFVEDELMRLPPGVAMLVSNDIERPVLVDIRVRKSKHGGESVNVLKSSRKASPEPVKRASKKVSSPSPKPAPVEQKVPLDSPPPKRIPTKEVGKEGGGLFKKIFGSEK
ncbi:helicase HerA domain-containing protein [Methanococcoides seepicolus]|uniref:ATP-binding protein n=1 Tax=Methanococcoides seepicolus TaxID=2828780 RepID=A0A9E4ZFN6_9EURY|nr:ATP-binding protein [Methanococcoides seepicolus]MCM1987030.1 ATP-binding protein [Methanococcoides seepicolus]